MKTKLICFDLDDTLIREVHSVMLPCILNGREEEHAIIQKQEEVDSWIILQQTTAEQNYLQA